MFLLLVVWAVVLRLCYIWGGTFPFMYDHGRDALAVLELVKTHSPVLIGPRASIPGLYFGPGWYYLLAVIALVSLHPMAPVLLMVALLLLQLLLLKHYFGWYAAVIAATTTSWLWLSTSAWNPFPIALTSLLLIILLKKTREAKSITALQSLGMGLAAGFGFHFSSAYAIFYPVIILIVLRRQRLRLSLRAWLALACGFLIPLVPQMLFELRHQFIQSKSVLTYLQSGGDSSFSLSQALTVVKTIIFELSNGTLPSVAFLEHPAATLVRTLMIAAVLIFSWKKWTSLKKSHQFFDVLPFILIPSLGYLFLHFSPWYVLGMLPAATLMVAVVIQQANRRVRQVIVAVYLIASLLAIVQYLQVGRTEMLQNKNSLAAKMEAIAFVRATAAGQPFSSYHYAPDVYDYPYQYLYFFQATQGQPLPIEFAYQHQVPTYIPEKERLLQVFAPAVQSGKQPQLIFFVVEAADNPDHLQTWWNNQVPVDLLGEKSISPSVTVFWGSPKNSQLPSR